MGENHVSQVAEILQLCHDIADDWCRIYGRETALEMASERYHAVTKYWQRANWRMIRQIINRRVNSPSD